MVKEDGDVDVDGRRLEVEMMMRDEGGETGVEEGEGGRKELGARSYRCQQICGAGNANSSSPTNSANSALATTAHDKDLDHSPFTLLD
jgi:hypothetical protein